MVVYRYVTYYDDNGRKQRQLQRRTMFKNTITGKKMIEWQNIKDID